MYIFRNNILYIMCRLLHNLLLIKFTRLFPIFPCLRNTKLNQAFAMPAPCYFTFYNYTYSIKFYIHPRSSSTHDVYSDQYGSHLKISHVLFPVITECLELKFKASLLTYLLHGAEFFLRSQLVLQLVKKSPALYGTRRFITLFRSTRHQSLS